ncbi:MAG: hypothetical protein CVU05_05060 [Bacteroidetes bacterium HGW-Bacteroidetes-21]|jgi:hypothetical protein|nr:MAG: hypothetical protein CVU05_05060 [Bacteroidetes bacterium HGW-Bacteroidetes-21]
MNKVSISQSIESADNTTTNIQDSSKKVRNIIGFVPSKADVINGWAIGWLTLNEHENLKMNGLYTNINPIQIYYGVYVSLFTIWTVLSSPELKDETNDGRIYGFYKGIDSTVCDQRFNGISISIVDFGDRTKMNGIELSLVSQHMNQNNGISVSGLFNKKVKFNGLMVGLINLSEQGHGLQMGLINNCGNMHGVQLGLINRCGKRLTPFLNFRF